MKSLSESTVLKESDIRRSFGLAVKRERGREGFSQEMLADRAGLHRTYISDIERGSRNVSLENIGRLAYALGISIRVLMPSEIPPMPEGAAISIVPPVREFRLHP